MTLIPSSRRAYLMDPHQIIYGEGSRCLQGFLYDGPLSAPLA